MRGGGFEGVSGWAESVENSCGRMCDGGSSLVGSVRSSPTREAPSEIHQKVHIFTHSEHTIAQHNLTWKKFLDVLHASF